MKRVLFVIAICAVQAFSQAKGAELARHECRNSTDEAALRRIADSWKEAYNAGDSAKVASLYTEDAYYLTQHFGSGILHGRNRIMAYFKMGTDAGFRMDKIDVIETACSGDFGYAISRYESTNAGQKAFGVNLLVLRKIKGKWYIRAHESAVPDATAIQKLPTEEGNPNAS